MNVGIPVSYTHLDVYKRQGLCILVLLVAGALAGTYMYRLTSFNTEEFAGRLQADLSAALIVAKSVLISAICSADTRFLFYLCLRKAKIGCTSA